MSKKNKKLESKPVDFRIYDIEWDLDSGDESLHTSLPEEVIVRFDSLRVHALRYDREELEDEITEEITDRYGACVKGYKYEKVKMEK